MRSLSGFTALPSILICSLAGCSSVADIQDELASEATNEGLFDGKVDGDVDGAYFAVTADLRKCPSPVCGGWFFTRLNRPMTRCSDGRYAASCYTPVLDWSAANLSDEQKTKLLDSSNKGAVSGAVYAMMRGRFAPTNSTTPRPELGRFVITEGWVADGNAVADGTFVKVKDNGLRCLVAPCPSLTEAAVNTPRSADIAEIDWTLAGLSDDQLEECMQSLSTPEGIMVAGDRYRVQENGSTAKGRTATIAYRRLTDAGD